MLGLQVFLSLAIAFTTESCTNNDPVRELSDTENAFVGTWWVGAGFLAIDYYEFRANGEYIKWSNLSPKSEDVEPPRPWRVIDDVLIREWGDDQEWNTKIVKIQNDHIEIEYESGRVKKYTRISEDEDQITESKTLECNI